MRVAGESWFTWRMRWLRLRFTDLAWRLWGSRQSPHEPCHALEETPAMCGRSACARKVGTSVGSHGWRCGEWFFVPGGYGELAFRNILGSGILPYYVAYVALPPWHPDIGKDYDGLPGYGPAVNGGLTYSDGNVFGWDYAHGWNEGGVLYPTVMLDMELAVAYFKGRDPRQPLRVRVRWWWEWRAKDRVRQALVQVRYRLKRAWARFEGPSSALRREEA